MRRSYVMPEDIKLTNIKDGARELTVRVFLDGPELEGLDVQALAQQAWYKPGRMLRQGGLTVIVARSKR